MEIEQLTMEHGGGADAARAGPGGEATAADRESLTANIHFFEVRLPRLQQFAELHQHRLPVVHFDNGRNVVVLPALFRNEVSGRGLANRLQVPLRLAYAITIHKSQGMSMPAAVISASNCFAAGQAYVALSRVETLGRLHLLTRLTDSSIKADPQVIGFYHGMRARARARRTQR